MEREVLEFVMKRSQKLCFEEIFPDTNLGEAGMNSLNAIGLIVDIETNFKIRFLDDEISLMNIETPSKLAEIVVKKIKEKSE